LDFDYWKFFENKSTFISVLNMLSLYAWGEFCKLLDSLAYFDYFTRYCVTNLDKKPGIRLL